MRRLGAASGCALFCWWNAPTCSTCRVKRSLLAGAALECVHCYSLVHDDLPAMDNDDLRRGQPTTHKAFDEATAILAGDGLLTFAFDLLSSDDVHPSADVRLLLVRELARASGLGGMVGGQMLDLAAEGRFDAKAPKPNEAGVATLQAMKTGALIRFACRAGAILAEADEDALGALDRFGRAIGQAYQVADDLLDVYGDPKVMGKAAGKDAAAGKATLAGMLGREGARADSMHCCAMPTRRSAGSATRQAVCARRRASSPSGRHDSGCV